MSESSVPSAPGNDEPAVAAADETTRTPFSWPARAALVAAAGLVVGGVAFTATEVAAALRPADPAPTVAEERTSSERRTTPLTGTAQPEDAQDSEEAERAQGDQAAEQAADTPAQGSGDVVIPETGGGAPGTLSEGDPGWVDPRKEILAEILNTPQDRPPLEPGITQEELDALREAAEADAVVEVPELDYSEYYEVAPDTRP